MVTMMNSTFSGSVKKRMVCSESSLPTLNDFQERGAGEFEGVPDLQVDLRSHPQVLQEALGQAQETEGISGRRRIPDDQVVAAVADALQDVVQHELLLDARGHGHVVHHLVVGKVHQRRRRCVHFGPELLLPAAHHLVRVNLQPVEVLHAGDGPLGGTDVGLKDVGEGGGEVAGDDEGAQAPAGEVEGRRRRGGGLADAPFAAEHQHPSGSGIQGRQRHGCTLR
jgi:hypothetical protein